MAGATIALTACGSDDGGAADGEAPDTQPTAPTLTVDTDMWRDLAECIDVDAAIVPADGDAAPEGVDGVVAVEDIEASHVDGCVDYPSSPPVGGPHFNVWATCGLYLSPVAAENAVHSMEHGAVWIAYPVDIGDGDLDGIRERVASSGHVLASPYPGLDGELVLSAWGRQSTIPVGDTTALDDFLSTYVEGPQTPEPGATCSRGMGAPTNA